MPNYLGRQYRNVAGFCAGFVVLISILAVLGWQFDIFILKTLIPGYVSIKMNTAIGLGAFALSILLLTFQEDRKFKSAVFALASVGTIIGLATLMQYAFGWNLKIDEFFYTDSEVIGRLHPPGRMAPVTALSFVLMGAGTYFGFFVQARSYRLSQALFFIVGLVSVQAIVGYALGVQTTFGVALQTRIALHTAVSLILLSFGFLTLAADRGFVHVVFSRTRGGITARRLLLAAIFIPPCIGLLERTGINAGYFDADFGALFRILGSMIFFVVLILRNAEKLHLSDQGHKEAVNFILEKEDERGRLIAERKSALAREESEVRLREELIESRSRAEKAAGAKAEFLANMSHEIRTPLNGVIGIADLLADTKLDSQQMKYVKTLQSSGSGLLNIINEILDFSKIEAGKIELENVDFNLHSMMQSQVDLLRAAAVEKGLAINIAFDSKIPNYVNGDPGRIGQVLLNLIGNAIKFTKQGSVTVRATALDTAEPDRIGVKLSVEDTGIGIPQGVQSRLFQPFAQADGSTSRKFGGTGLGLSISRSLVHMMGGKIGLVSENETGSTFWFSLSLKLAESSRRSRRPAELSSASVLKMSLSKQVRVLVAEDNVVNQMVVMAQLRSLGLEGQTVANGQEVLNALKIKDFHLILMDCQMPEMDGYAATQIIRDSEKITGKHIPIIALTANVMKEDQDKCVSAGMDAYLSKPFKREALESLLQRWLPADVKLGANSSSASGNSGIASESTKA